MKLRKKKTGAIIECEGIVFTHCNALALDWEQYSPNINSLAELNEEWEDYAPQEPLIEDEKIRKAVRAWAEVNSIKEVLYATRTDGSLCVLTDMGNYDFSIEFVGYIQTLKDGGVYTIDELCGEEEE